MFHSVSGHNSEQSTAHYSYSQLYCSWKVSPILCQTDLRITNHRGHKFPPLLTLLSFKTRIKWSRVDRNRKLSERILSTPSMSKATSKLFGLQGCSDDKNWLDFFSIFFKICRFHSSFLLSLKFSFHEKPVESSLTVAWFFWTNHTSLLHIATNEIASFCIDNRLRQMTFFVFVGKGRLSSDWERFWN